ncbi:uncharacterized protein LY89DRAFT_775969 [Mollisia scopiformis]|uniref:Uncharacterized protein n=1 Tax=Mollisia scopiformis TaxID=149040 RepID=A0A194XU21_MOLSC|nr:uncharacterized protein LY89DRAFT_775969 [Mollisia scopiformis]KUJ23708.1 hypothetical protein LY89DRAFT_775969 [Mollisia scopiformis]
MSANTTTPHPVSAEVAARIATTPHEGLQSLCDITEDLTIGQAKYHKYNPRTYFTTLIDDPDFLLKSMCHANVGLSGSRAAAFFYPHACTPESDWDFYCSGGDVAVAKFTHLLTSLGATWGINKKSNKETNEAERKKYGEYSDNFSTVEGQLNGHSIQVMWDHEIRKGAFQTILEFHSSIVQCFISASCAVSMYHNISSQNQLVAWYLDWVLHPVKRAKAPKCVAKYVSRGFEVVPYSRKLVGLPNYAQESALNLPSMPRAVSDKGCLLINFDVYQEAPNAVDTALHSATMEEIMNLRWTEELNSELCGPETRSIRGMYRALRSVEPEHCLRGYLKTDGSYASHRAIMSEVTLRLEKVAEEPEVQRLAWGGKPYGDEIDPDTWTSYPVPWMPVSPAIRGGWYQINDKLNYPPV